MAKIILDPTDKEEMVREAKIIMDKEMEMDQEAVTVQTELTLIKSITI